MFFYPDNIELKYNYVVLESFSFLNATATATGHGHSWLSACALFGLKAPDSPVERQRSTYLSIKAE